MPSLISKVNEEITTAMKAHDAKRTGVLRLLKSALADEEIAKRSELTEEDEIKIVRREIKKRLDAIEKFKAGNRNDLAEQEEYEIGLFNVYLPAEMGDEELRSIVTSVITENPDLKADFGKAMKAVMEKLGGKVGGNRVSGIIKELLK